MDYTVHGILQARILEWEAFPFPTGKTRQEYWSGWPCSPPGDLSDSGAEPEPLTYPALAGGFSTTSTAWEALTGYTPIQNKVFVLP